MECPPPPCGHLPQGRTEIQIQSTPGTPCHPLLNKYRRDLKPSIGEF